MEPASEIVVADDEGAMRYLLQRALQRWGFAVTPCAEGGEALRAVAAKEGRALLLLDYAMPGLNGAEVCRVVRAHGNPLVAQTPIILLTAHGGERQELECLRAGADDFVSKPVHLPVLRARIQTHLRLAALRTRLREQNRELETWRASREEDMEAAALIQRALVPQAFPAVTGWRSALFFQPFVQVGGDSFGALPAGNGDLLVWIADATGHGVAAALVTALLGLLFRHAVEEEPGAGPGRVLAHVHRDFATVLQGRTMPTAACVRVQPGSGVLRFAGAGHPPGIVVRHDGRTSILESMAPPLGVTSSAVQSYEEENVTLEPGDALVLLTDGIYDWRRFTITGLLTALAVAKADSPEGLIESIITAAQTARGGERFEDDVALTAFWRD